MRISNSLAWIGVGVLILQACGSPQLSWFEQETAIRSVMRSQQEAWNAGDLRGFMNGYWENDSLVFIGGRGLSKGWDAALSNYQRSYPDQQAMGKLQFTHEIIEPVGDRHAFVVGRWELFRDSDTLSGHYSLLWKLISGKWVIVADHSS